VASAKKSKKYKPNKQPAVTSAAEQKKTSPKISEKRRKTGPYQPLLPGKWQSNVLIFLGLMIATVIIYSGDLHLGFFAVDDPGYITNNPWIKNISGENVNHILTTPYFANYSPVHLFSYMFDYALAGPSPYAFHLSSNIWAGIVSGFVYLVGLAFTKNRLAAIMAAILFIVHPVHVEAVAWISSRKDLIATAFALPSLLAYMKYRQVNGTKKIWYVLSLFLFTLAVAGKLSVATFPAVFFAWDLFIEKRSFVRSLIDKIPFLIVTLIIALAATSAQPSMGNQPDPYAISAVLIQNIWLLTGFANYVIYRIPPGAGSIILQILALIFLLAVFAAPLLLRRRWPKVTVLIYWILFAFIPAQILSFTHPVADRYLFFPSVAVAILIAWGLFALTKKLGKQGTIAAIAVAVIISFFWVWKTLSYLQEWRDPRSVWFAAISKTSDPVVFQNLGTYYLGTVEQLNATKASKSAVSDEVRGLASIVWKDNPKLPTLLSVWDQGKRESPEELAFQNQLRSLAWEAFDQSLKRKGNRIMPGLYYNRGLVLLNNGDLEGAKKEFLTTLDEASKETFAEVREQLTVYSHYDLGIIAWKKADYQQALKWFKMAEEEQTRFGGNWLPDISQNRKRMEQIVSSQSNH
jgi:4-amino-4-deoxy-L-arabinose transferase-like glycosyltransferase